MGCAPRARVKERLLWVCLLVALLSAAVLALAATASGAVITNANDALRTGWYPDEGSITPSLVSGPTWGQLWSAQVDGQVYAQPLLAPSGTLIVTTENDSIYGLNPATGAVNWTRNLAPNGAWDPSDVGCSDIVPLRGSTSTPVIDSASDTVYLTYKTYDDPQHDNAQWWMDARDVTTGAERSGFPVQLSGPADNDHALTFNAADQDQRTGLLLMNGVVYAGFGSECDHSPFEGWVFGVTTSGQPTARWVSVTSGDGGGVWQSGVGLSSDRSGSILISTGNGGAPTVASPGNAPPSSCGECAIRLDVQSDGKLEPVDFFAPFDAQELDQTDTDFGSTGVVGLPDQYFGTSSIPHLAVAGGKEGYVYLLNRDDLGGYQQGAFGGDAVVDRQGPFGAVFGRPGVWPGDGGYIYVPTSCCQNGGGNLDVYQYGLNASGSPSLTEVATSSDTFGFGSGSPVVTSDGTTSGSALVWIIWAANRMGNAGQLRAYDPVPVNGQPVLRWSASLGGNATNYSTPGVGAGRLYVGTRDGKVIAFGSPVSSPLGGSGLTFPRTTVGSSSGPQTLTITANRDNVTINSVTSSDPSEFVLGTPSPAVGSILNTGEQMTVPVTFSPGHPGPIGGQVTASTSAGDVTFPLSGTGQDNGPSLAASTRVLSLGGTSVGGHLTGSFVLTNQGSQPVTIQGLQPPAAPFSSSDAPSSGTIDPGKSISVDISFDPTSVGQFTGAIGFDSNSIHGQVSVSLSATAGTPGDLEFSSQAIDFGSTPVESNATRSFTITNAGGTPVTIEKSKPPFGGAFTATTTLPEGTSIAPGQTVTESVTFSPTATGPASGTWAITGNDTSGAHQVQFNGTGATPSAGGGSGGSSPPAKKPALPAAPKLAPGVASTARLGSIFITYTAKLAGVSQFVLQRAVVGRRGTHGCVATTARNRSRPRCTRFVTVKSFIHRDRAGAARLRLGAFVALGQLVPGRYRLESVLLDSAGGKHAFTTTLRIVPPARPARRHATRSFAPAMTPLGSLLRQLAATLSPF